MKDLTTSFSRTRHRMGVIEMGLKSAQLTGGTTLGIGWMMDIFQESGMYDDEIDRLNR